MRRASGSAPGVPWWRRVRPRTVVLGLLTLVLLWLLVEAGRAAVGARQTVAAADDVQQAVEDGRWSELPASGRELEHASGRFASATSSPPMVLLGLLPLIGDDVRAVRRAAVAVHQASDGAHDLLALGDGLDPASLTSDGRVDLARLRAMQQPAARAAEGLGDAKATLADVDAAGLVGPLQKPVTTLQDAVDKAQPKVDTVAAALKVLPDMLGASGSRRYLVALQNPAESRPTGGIIGSFGVIGVRDGELELTATGVNNDLEQLKEQDLDVLDPTTRALYGTDQRLSPNFNLSPDFSQAAALFARQWVANDRPPVAGVLSLDPVVLQAILSVTGPVKVPGGPSLDGRNAAGVLMDRAYRDLGGNTPARNAYLEAATRAVFVALLRPSTDLHAVITKLSEPANRHHVMMWSRLADENDVLERAGISGRLPAPEAGTVGVFTTNVDASKLDYFLRSRVRVLQPCDSSGPVVQLTLDNTAPADVTDYAADKLPGQARTDHTVNVSWYVPPQRGLVRLTVNGKVQPYQASVEQGWSVVRVAVTVPRGEQAKLAVELTGAYLPVEQVATQPAAHDTVVTKVACSS